MHKGDIGKAVGIIGDAISNPGFNAGELELLKDAVADEHELNHTQYEYTTLENAHFNSFRDH